jgi:Carboxypeptidase regulatory-like domain
MAHRGSFPLCPFLGPQVFGCLALLLAASIQAYAQGAGSARLRGTVSDSSGGVLPGASVTVVNQRTSLTRRATTDAHGEYICVALPANDYRVEVELQGFARWRSAEIHLGPGDSMHLATRLTMEERTEEVTVEAARTILRVDTGAREGTVTADQIQNLSIVSRSALELLRILPGTVAPSGSDLETVSFFGGPNALWATSVNGTRGTSISPVLDGSKLVDIGSSSGLMISMNADMVDEIKVQSSNYAAEYGTSGVQVTAVTKGGSSSFHGSLYDYWRNWRFAANDRSNTAAQVPRPKSDYQYPGLNLSGPVLVPGTGFNKNRDKLFFFVGFEYQHQLVDTGTTLAVVPTLKQREGNFSELLDGRGQNLAQPSIVTIPAGFPGAGEPAPGNDLRPYVDRIGRGFLHMYPLPNFTDPDNRYNYAFTIPQPLDRWQLVSRLDWNVSASTHAYVRLALEQERNDWARGVWGTWSSFELPEHVIGDNRSRSISLDVTSVLGPSLTNEVIFSAGRLKLDNDWHDPSHMTLKGLGLDGYRGAFDTGATSAPVGFYSWGQNLGNLATGVDLPVYAYNDSISFADSLAKVLRAHTLKAGLFVERAQKQQNFSTLPSFLLGSTWIVGGTGDDYGDLLVGRLAQYYEDTPVPHGEFRFWNYEAYVQDAWKASRNLTLELGLRVAQMPNNEEVNGLGLLFDPSAYHFDQGAFIDGDPARPNGVLRAKQGEIPKGMVRNPGLNVMPRVNFAWDVQGNGSLTVRGGAGLFHHRARGDFQYYVLVSPPNQYNTTLYASDVPGGLTISSLSTIDPYSHVASGSVQSQDPRSVHLPRTWNWSLGVAKRLPWQQTFEVAYVGHRADHLPNTTLSNYIAPGKLAGLYGNADLGNPLHRVALDPSVAAALTNYPAYNEQSLWYQYEAVSSYHGFQATLNRSAGRIQYFLNYTFSKALGTTGDDFAIMDPVDPTNRSHGVLPQDRTHIFNASYTVQLPEPIGPRGSAVLRQALNGWQISGITSYSSGLPFRVGFTGDLDRPEMNRAWWGTDGHAPTWNPGLSSGQAGGITPVFLGNPSLPNTKIGQKVLDIDKITFPAFGESGPFQSPYYFRAPSRWNWDVTIFKNFAVGSHGKRIQLRTGFFNVFNQAAPRLDFGDIDLTLQTECNVRVDGVPNGAGGTADGVCDPTKGFHFTDLTKQNFGKIVSKHGHRVIELAARFDF